MGKIGSDSIDKGHTLRTVVGIIVLALLLADGAGATSITVNASGGADYMRIQDAINNASGGDTILVHNGTYYENVDVNKQLTLRGIGMPVVDARGSGSAIKLAADGIIFEGFTATGSGYYWQDSGIWVISSFNTLIGNTISSNQNNGIYLRNSNNNTLNSNIASNNGYSGISLFYSSNNTLSENNASNNFNGGPGILLYSSSSNTLIGNNVTSNNRDGISMYSSSKNVLINNTMKGNEYNFGFWGNSYSDFDNQIETSNLVDGKPIYYVKGSIDTVYDSSTNAGTFYCINCVNVTIKNLDLKNNSIGIFLWNTSLSKIQNVNFSKNNDSIIMSFSNNNTISDNIVSNNYDGIVLYSSSNNRFYNNYFNNTNYIISDTNYWNNTKILGINIINGSYFGGNFWANSDGTGFSQTCTDADRNGICDSAYVLDANNIDYLPLSTNFTFYNLTGRVTNASSGLGIPGAFVKLDAYPQYNAMTNSIGDYSISVPAGTYNVNASAAGYATNTTTIIVSADTVKDFALVTTENAFGSDRVWIQVSNMSNSHVWGSGIITLDNGKVLVTVGANAPASANIGTSSSELFDPLSRTWTTTGSVNQVRWLSGNAIVKMNDGKVMVAGNGGQGGLDLSSVELYDPSTGTWSYTGSLQTARRNPAVIKLQNGKVLITGGANGPPDGNRFLASTEIYDPATGQWTYSGNLNIARELGNNIILLHDGRVVIAGGEGPWWVQGDTAEIYDPNTGQWTLAPPMLYGWGGVSMTVLKDGRVLVTGGYVPTQRAMLYDPGTNTWTETGSMHAAKAGNKGVLLTDGKVLVMGDGTDEIYDPATGQWTTAAEPHQSWFNGIAVLQNGDILAVGGDPEGLTAELFTESLSNSGTAFNISGYKINDTNGNGQWDAGEACIPGWNITLKNATTGAAITSNLTDANGFYQFQNLPNGTYNVSEEMLSGFTNVTPMSIIVTINGADVLNQNFTNVHNGLVAEYHFDGDAKDSSGNGIDGTIYGATVVDGVRGKALSFDGVDDYIDVGGDSSLKPTTSFTYSVWIKFSASQKIRVIMGSYNDGVGGVALGIDDIFDNKIKLHINEYGIENNRLNSQHTLNDGLWHNVVGTYEDSNLRLYVDGILDASKSGISNPTYPDINFNIGRWVVGLEYFNGLIDEVRIYNRALSAEEIRQHYEEIVETNLTASITSPSQPTFAFGTSIDFASEVSGGAPPYNYSWESSRNGIISTVQSFSISNLSIGTHTITLTVTDANGIKATNTKAITVTGVDLGLKSSDISFSNSWPMQNEEITINASITNDGSDSASNVSVRFYDGTILIGEALIPSISHQSSGVAEIRYAPNISGYRFIKVVVDEANNITEGDETNNIAIRPLSVGNGNFYGGIEISTFIDTPKYTGEYTRVYGSAVYNTTFSSGENVAGALVTITIDGKSYTTYTTSSGTFSTDIIAPYNSGQYPVVVRITDNTFVKEKSLILNVYPWPAQLPDLVITTGDITFPQTSYVVNESSAINATILNIGRADASEVTVNFYDDGDLFKTETISSIPNGGSVTTSGIFTPSHSGTHTITVKVDANNTIPETNENNNQAFRSLYVYPDLPDFTPSYIYYSDSTPYDGQQVMVSAYIANIGSIDSPTNVSFYLDNNFIDTIGTVPVSVPGRSGYATASLPITFVNPGTHQIKVIADEAGNVREADEGNNQTTSSIYVHTPQPDLKANDIFLNISDPVLGDSVLVTGVFRNDGETSANNVIANLYNGGTLVNSIPITNLAAGSAETITSSWTPITNGYFDIKLSIDPQNTIVESNEDNNVRTETYYIYPDLPDPYPISLVSTPSMADIGQPVNIEAIIKNKGGTSTGMMNISLYDDELEISSSRVEVPGKGGTVPVSKVYSFATNGTHTIKMKADPDNAILEFDESNNELTSTIYILSPLPDIQILSEDIYYSNNNPMIDENVVIYANVSNIGTYQAENIDVIFYIDDILINTTTISSISSKSSIIVTSDWIAEGNGSHVVRIETLFSGLELSKTNNVATRGLVVGQDAVPPSSVTNLHNITYASTHINWTWTDPIDPDFDKVMIYLNGTFQRNATNGTQYYNATGLTPNTNYEISTRTVDLAGNINSTWENQSAMTAPAVNENTPPGNNVQVSPAPNVTVNFSNVTASGNTTVNVTTTNPRSDKTGFKFQKTYYDFITDAVYTGPITICLNYDDSGLSIGRERNLKIFHWNDSIGWEDVTTSLDTDNNVVCGTVSSFSWFGIAELLPTERFINGTVKDNSTGNGLAGVTVSANSTLSKTTNASGFYSFAVNEGTYELTATFDITYYTNTTTVSTIGEAVVIQDIELIKKPTGNITGSVSAK